MDALAGNVSQRAVDHALPFDAAFARERRRFDLDGKMGLARSVVPGMAGMFGAVVDDGKAARRKRVGEQVFDFGGDGHALPFARRHCHVKAMRVEITKGDRFDTIAIRRDDGSAAETRFPKKGPLPHDGIHYIVEDVLGLSDAFWGKVAGGRHPEDIQDLAKAAGHASAKRAQPPGPDIVELLQAERLVECVEARAWDAEPGDPQTFISVAEAACHASHVSPPPLNVRVIAQLDDRVAALSAEWAEGRFAFDWPPR